MSSMAFPSSSVRPPVSAKTVLESLSKHILVDGYHVVMDLKASRGNFLRDSLRGVEILDFFSNFATCPIGYAHPRKTMYFPKFDWPRVVNPKLTFPVTPESLAVTIALEDLSIAQAEQAIHDSGDDIAAFILEPIQGEGGDNHFRPEFLARVRALCEEHDMLFILDEVQTGMGLTGTMWAFQGLGVTPDLFSFGKKTQVCGFASNGRILEEKDNVFTVSSRINSTWGGNLVDMVRCRKFLEIMDEEKLVQNAKTTGEFLLRKLNEVASEFAGKMTNVRGRGLFIAFDLPDGKARGGVLSCWLQKHNVMALPSGERASVSGGRSRIARSPEG